MCIMEVTNNIVLIKKTSLKNECYCICRERYLSFWVILLLRKLVWFCQLLKFGIVIVDESVLNHPGFISYISYRSGVAKSIIGWGASKSNVAAGIIRFVKIMNNLSLLNEIRCYWFLLRCLDLISLTISNKLKNKRKDFSRIYRARRA